MLSTWPVRARIGEAVGVERRDVGGGAAVDRHRRNALVQIGRSRRGCRARWRSRRPTCAGWGRDALGIERGADERGVIRLDRHDPGRGLEKVLLRISGAAPLYAVTPTSSKMNAPSRKFSRRRIGIERRARADQPGRARGVGKGAGRGRADVDRRRHHRRRAELGAQEGDVRDFVGGDLARIVARPAGPNRDCRRAARRSRSARPGWCRAAVAGRPAPPAA